MRHTYMTVGVLRAMLSNYSDDTKVLLSRDSEGNCFSPCDFCEQDGEFETLDCIDDVYCMKDEDKKGSFVILYPTL